MKTQNPSHKFQILTPPRFYRGTPLHEMERGMNPPPVAGEKGVRWIFVICALSFVIILCGCAKVVTPVFAPAKTITLDINYRGNIDTILNKYYIIFNKNSAPQIPFMPEQFVEPGEIPAQTEVDYYGKYYPSWMGFIVLDGNSFSYVGKPFTSEAIPTKEVIATWSGAEVKRIFLTINIGRIGTFTDKDRIHFDFITIDKSSKLVRDNLSTLNSSPSPCSIFTISDSSASGSDETTTVTRESLDILNWKVMVND